MLPADQGRDETRFDLHYATSLSTDSTQARDQPVTKVQTGPGAQLLTSARSACHPKPQGRNRSERGCSGQRPRRVDASPVAPSPVLPNNYPSAVPTPTTHTLMFCKSGFGILASDLPDKRRLCGALNQGNHCKVSKLLCGQPILALQETGGGGAAALQPPSFLHCDWKPEPRLLLPSARSISFKDKAGVCTRSPGSLKLEVTFWLPWYSQCFTAGPR